MSIALIANTLEGSSDGTNVTTSPIDTTGASLLILVTTYAHSVTPSTPTDNKSNSWTALTEAISNSCNLRFWYCPTPTVGSGHTFSFVATSGLPALAVIAVSGITGASVDQQNNFTSGGGHGANNVASVGTVTPTDDGELFILALANDTAFGSSGTVTNDGGIMTHLDFVALNDPFGTPDHFTLSTWWGVQPTATARNINVSWGASASYSLDVATFSIGAPVVRCRRTLSAHGTRIGVRQPSLKG